MPKKILAVDDSKTIRLIVSKAFKAYDCAVLEAANGVEGLSLAAKEKPDLIILDLTMPVMDGYEMLNRLRADRDLKQVPVIMLTAEVGRDNVIKVAKQGVRDYVVKPFKEDLIVERGGRVLELKLRPTVPTRTRKYDEPLKFVVLDDKPAIAEQIRAGVADTKWQIIPKAQPAEALEYCRQNPVDGLLISLNLADDAAFTTFENLRAAAATRTLPVFGLSVKTATDEQNRAADITLIRLAIEAAQLGATLGIQQRVAASANHIKDCKNYEEAKDWQFSASLDEAIAAFEPKGTAPVAAAAPVLEAIAA